MHMRAFSRGVQPAAAEATSWADATELWLAVDCMCGAHLGLSKAIDAHVRDEAQHRVRPELRALEVHDLHGGRERRASDLRWNPERNRYGFSFFFFFNGWRW